MLGTTIIVFREVLEAALIVGIVAAATRGVEGRARWIAGGLALGIAGSLAVAGAAEAISQLAQGVGQELFNASILAVAVAMLAWHNIWMSAHGREISLQAKNVGSDIREGAKTLGALLVVIAVAVLREGSETVLFLYGVSMSGGASTGSMMLGGAVGLGGGVAVGYLMFAGLLRIPLRWFFAATSFLVLLLAAGMASQAARFLIQANVLPSPDSPVWDTSAIVANSSIAGKVLQSLVGYDAQPAAMQVAFFMTAIAVISIGMIWARRPRPAPAAE